MAKDKGTKPDKNKSSKADKGGKSKGKSEFAKPSDAPASGDGWKFEDDDNVGSLFLINPLRTQTVKTDKYGDTEVVVADIVELNEKKPEKSELHEDAYIFGGWTKGATRGYIGESKVLGRLGQDAAKSKSKTPAWVLEDADDDDIAIARQYLETVDPFGKGGKTKGGGKDKAKSKGKAGKNK